MCAQKRQISAEFCAEICRFCALRLLKLCPTPRVACSAGRRFFVEKVRTTFREISNFPTTASSQRVVCVATMFYILPGISCEDDDGVRVCSCDPADGKDRSMAAEQQTIFVANMPLLQWSAANPGVDHHRFLCSSLEHVTDSKRVFFLLSGYSEATTILRCMP